MDEITIRELYKKIQAPSYEYIVKLEKEWNEAVALLKRSKKDLSKIPIVKEH